MTAKPTRKRLDLLLVERGLADSTAKAQAMILAGEVQVDGQRADKAGSPVTETSRIDVHRRSQKYSSRGGFKLEGALEDFHVTVSGAICLDVGSSTGGFTDCLLQHGAVRVYAVDVNTAQLDWKLHDDPRVVKIEKNARELSPGDIAEPVQIVVMDVSFISATMVLPGAVACSAAGAEFLVLVKPQFELGREEVGEGGIVRDLQLHRKAIAKVQTAAESLGLVCLDTKPSRLTGAEGNQEYFLHARKPAGVESP